MPLAVTSSSLSSDPRRVADIASRLKFDGLLVDAIAGAVDLTELSGTGLREFRQVVTRQNVALVGLQAELGPRGLGPGADVDRVLARCEAVFDCARKLQASVVCLEIGALPEPPAPPAPRRPTADEAGLIFVPSFEPAPVAAAPAARAADPAMQSQVDSAMTELGRLADRYTVSVAVRSDLASLAALERALGAARCPWFGVDLNPAAVLGDDWSMHEVFSRLGPLVRHVRGRDAVSGADRRTKPMPVSLGDTHWDELLADLSAADYHGWITLDPVDLLDRLAAAVKGLAYLRLHEE